MEPIVKKKKRFVDNFKEAFPKLIIILVSLSYIGQGIFKITKKDVSFLVILGAIALSIIVGLIISANFKNMGIRDGRRSDVFIGSIKSYGVAKEQATPYFDKLFNWCEYKNDQELLSKKKEIVQSAGLSWKAFRIGYYEEHTERLSQKQIESLETAKTCTINKITSQEILSDLPKQKYGFFRREESRFGETEQEYKTRGLAWDIISRFFVGIICGLYSLAPLFTEENLTQVLASVVWNTIQVVLWIALGLIEYANAKDFIEVEYRQTHIIQKTELLNEFIVTIQNNPHVIDNYDEEEEIELYIQEYIEQRKKKENLNNGENGQVTTSS